jgi:beta-lactamase regulating signal transducer with metallopeptidase domain
MHVLIGIALKSLLIAGLTLGLLHLMRRRSAAERSWVAHIGLLALVIMAFGPLVLPSWNVETPAFFGRVADASPVIQAAAPTTTATTTAKSPIVQAVRAAPARTTPTLPSLTPAAAATALYAVPAAILLFITLLALGRLIALRARAEVLVDGHWLSALARAQRRMGFKHGTALLTSNELGSPISWGLLRPVILLNSRAVEATGEAEAIIAHELAHVARMDWIKLLLARIATALFWFNPLVWLLAREAHQLREETADDSVLAADIVDTDYAQLLVGVARHECPGLLLGAHGVAPSKSSLARRVARVLDGKSVRGPVARSFALGVFSGAVLVAAPLAALTLTPTSQETPKRASARIAASEPAPAQYPASQAVPTDLASIIASGVSTSVHTAVEAATTAAQANVDEEAAADQAEAARERAQQIREQAHEAAANAREAAREARRADPISRAIEARAAGLAPEYIGAMRASVPSLKNVQFEDFNGLRALGVTPEYARALVAAGFPSITADELMQARAVGVSGEYVRAMRSAGVQGTLDDFVELRAVGVDPSFAARAKASGMRVLRADDLVELRALGISHVPMPPRPPSPPPPSRRGLPATSPPNWNPPNSGPDG